jgi:hypothetical protein
MGGCVLPIKFSLNERVQRAAKPRRVNCIHHHHNHQQQQQQLHQKYLGSSKSLFQLQGLKL